MKVGGWKSFRRSSARLADYQKAHQINISDLDVFFKAILAQETKLLSQLHFRHLFTTDKPMPIFFWVSDNSAIFAVNPKRGTLKSAYAFVTVDVGLVQSFRAAWDEHKAAATPFTP